MAFSEEEVVERLRTRNKVVMAGTWETCGGDVAVVDYYMEDGLVWIGTIGDSLFAWTLDGLTEEYDRCLWNKTKN